MAISLADNIRVGQQKPIEDKSYNGLSPYISVAEANSLIAQSVRYTGLNVFVINPDNENEVLEYWYQGGITDNDLVPKTIVADNIISENNPNPISSGAVYTALESIAFEPEINTWIENVKDAGDAILLSEAQIMNDVITAIKDYNQTGFIDKIVMFAPALGNRIEGSMTKLIINEGSTPYMINNGLTTELNYNKLKGWVSTTDGITNPVFIDTTVVPLNYSLNMSNIGLGYSVPDYTEQQGLFIIGDINPGGAGTYSRIFGEFAGQTGSLDRNQRLVVNGKKQVFVNYRGINNFSAYLNGGNKTNAGYNGYDTELNTSINIFRYTNNGSTFYTSGGVSVSYIIITEGLLDEEAQFLNRILYDAYVKLNRIPQGLNMLAFGDSNTAGQGISKPSDRFSFKVATALGLTEINLGLPLSQVTLDADGFITSAINRYKDLDFTKISTVLLMYGTNDSNNGGDFENLQENLETIIQYFLDRGVRVLMGSIPYNFVSTEANQTLWNGPVYAAALNKNVPIADMQSVFRDKPNPNSYLSDGILHYTTAGHELLTQKFISLARGIKYREPLIDLAPINPGEFTTQDIYIPNITPENAVALANFETWLDAGLQVSAYIRASNPNYVRLRIDNPTNSIVDPAPVRGMIKVIIN